MSDKTGDTNVFRALSDISDADFFKKSSLHKKQSFPLRISSVNATKSAVSAVFVQGWRLLAAKIICRIFPSQMFDMVLTSLDNCRGNSDSRSGELTKIMNENANIK